MTGRTRIYCLGEEDVLICNSTDESEKKVTNQLCVLPQHMRAIKFVRGLALAQVLVGSVVLVIVFVGGHNLLGAAWLWCVDSFSALWSAGVINQEAASEYLNASEAVRAVDLSSHITQRPLALAARGLNGVSLLLIVSIAISVVQLRALRVAERSHRSQK